MPAAPEVKFSIAGTRPIGRQREERDHRARARRQHDADGLAGRRTLFQRMAERQRSADDLVISEDALVAIDDGRALAAEFVSGIDKGANTGLCARVTSNGTTSSPEAAATVATVTSFAPVKRRACTGKARARSSLSSRKVTPCYRLGATNRGDFPCVCLYVGGMSVVFDQQERDRRAAAATRKRPTGRNVDAAQAGVDPGQGAGRGGIRRDPRHRARAWPSHGVRRGGLPEHRRVLEPSATPP